MAKGQGAAAHLDSRVEWWVHREECLDLSIHPAAATGSGGDTVSATYGHREGTSLTVLKPGVPFWSSPLSSPLTSRCERGITALHP